MTSRAFRLFLFFSVALAGCSDEFTLPTGPPAPPPSGSDVTFVWGYVLDSGNGCVRGAVVEVVDGPKAGAQFRQDECNFDDGLGYYFRDLDLPGRQVTLRASKAGYKSVDRKVILANGGGPTNFVLGLP